MLCLAILSLVTLALAARLPHLTLRTDGAALHPAEDPTVRRTLLDRQLFNDPEEILLLLSSRPGGPRLSSAAGLRTLAAVHREVASLDAVQGTGVRSAASLVDVAASNFASPVGFLDKVPEDPVARSELVDRMRAVPWMDGLFLARDGSAAVLQVPLAPAWPRLDAVAALEEWRTQRTDDGFDLRLTGPAAAEMLLGGRILADLVRLVPLMLLVLAGVLLLGLRTPGALLLGMGKVFLVLVWTAGVMELAGIPVTLVTTILPVLLTALCVTDDVHLLFRLQDRLAGPGSRDRRGDLAATLEELYRPVVYTSLSTALGFLSFLAAGIVPLRHLGALAAVGILVALGMTFTWTPAVVAVLPNRWLTTRSVSTPSAVGLGRGPIRSAARGFAFVAGLVLLLAAIPGLARLRVQDSWIDNFDPRSPLVQAERLANERFWGTYRHDVVLRGHPGTFHRPGGLVLVDDVASALEATPHVDGVVTYLGPLRVVADLLGLPAPLELPPDATEALFGVAARFPERTGLRRFVTRDGASARLILLVRGADFRRATAVAAYVEGALEGRLRDPALSFHVSGDLPVALATVRAVVATQLKSIAWTLAGVGGLLLLANRSLRWTLIQLLPPVAAAVWVLAGMGYAGVPLGVATSLFTALTLGVGVDLALHVTWACREGPSGAPGAQPLDGPAVDRAFARTEAGRRWSTVALALGFLVLTASSFAPNHRLGLLLGAAMAASYLATWLLLPRLMAR